MPKCIVPGCNNGSTANLRKVRLAGERPKSLFSVPKCEILFKKWEDSLEMKNKTLKGKSKVCESHFNKLDIIKYDDTILKDGTINRLPRYNYKLSDQAVPTAYYINNSNLCVLPKDDSSSKDDDDYDDDDILMQTTTQMNNNIFCNVPKDDSSEENTETSRITIKVYGNNKNNNLDTIVKMEYADIKQEDMIYQEELMPANDPLSENPYTFVRLKKDIVNHELIMPSGWTYVFQQSSVTFVYIHEFAIHVFCVIDKNMNVRIVTFDKRVTSHVDVQFFTTADILEYLNGLTKLVFCKGTGIASSYSKYCSGFVSPNEGFERFREYQRCKSCHEFRNATLLREKNLQERINAKLDDKRRKIKALKCAKTRIAKKSQKKKKINK